MNFGTREESAHRQAFQMTAMVDMVFILLAFFILASEFRLFERDVSLGSREAVAIGMGAEEGDFPSAVPVRLRKGEKGVTITIGAARLAKNDFDGIRRKLTEINMPSLGVWVQADADLTVQQVARAFDAVLASPMKKISISRIEKAAVDAPEGGG